MTARHVDPEPRRPAGRYLVDADSTWYYIVDDLGNVVVDQTPHHVRII